MQLPQLILLAHGSRDPRWCRTFEEGLEVINTQLDQPATLAYMEMATPSLETVVRDAYARGFHDFRILPLFFAAGRHLLQDVPEQLRLLEAELPEARFTLHEAAGQAPEFWAFMGRMIAGNEALNPFPPAE